MFMEMAARRRRKGGAGATFDPISLFTAGGGSGTGRLYDFKVASTLFSDAGVTQANIGDTVYRIADRTGAGNTDQPTASFQGIRRADGIELDGTDDYYPIFRVSGAAFTVAASVSFNAAAVSGYIIGQRETDTRRLGLVQPTATTFGVVTGGGVVSTPVDVRGTQVFADMVFSSSVLTARLNGTVFFTGSPTNFGANPSNWGALSNAANTPSAFMRGKLRGLLVIDRALTPSELASVQTYWS